MFNKAIITAIFVFSLLSINAENITFRDNNIYEMGDIQAGEVTDFSLTILIEADFECKNIECKLLQAYSRAGFSEIIITNYVYEGSQITVEGTYKQHHNVLFFDFVEFEVTCNENKLVVPFVISGYSRYNQDYYAETFNLYGSELQAKLSQIIDRNYVERTYKAARELFWSSFDNRDGFVECVYTGAKVETDGIPDVNSTRFNTEHTWPRAYGAEDEPELSDMFHIYPTTEESNSKRDSYPFGYVASNPIWSIGGSKLGMNSAGKKVFEARDAHKGNVARTIFYYATKWGNTDNFLDDTQESDLRQYMLIDPVDEWEARRNDSIYAYQGNRNPYIDHPEFLMRIDDFDGENSVKPDSVINTEYNLQLEVKQNEPLNFSFTLINPNPNTISINSVVPSNAAISVVNNPGAIEAFKPGKFDFSVNNSEFNETTVQITFNDLTETIDLNFELVEKVVSVNESNEVSEVAIYPNPADNEITIKVPDRNFNINETHCEIYNLIGRKVMNINQEIIESNSLIYKFDTEKLKIYGNSFWFVIKNNNKTVSNGTFLLNK